MLDIAYMLLTDSYYNPRSRILFELGAKLGNKASRSKNVYYARFFMFLANHVYSNLVVQFPANSKDCWVQNKRVLEDLNRLNHNKELQFVYPPIFNAAQEAQVSQVISSTVPSSTVISLISSATMEAGTVQRPPTQVATYKIPKSKNPTSGVSQKAPVVKNTKTLEGSVKEVVSGKRRGEHQRNPKNKEGEISVSQPSHPVSSQKYTVVEKEFITSLVAYSQKDVAIENSPQPGTQHERDIVIPRQ
ncbi:hypothetical protein POM88_049509 [Heracleum sosnowskyi]|uniref:Uncharacterized protein n=1 Tax=Heracleum sosnowskyi TaxID=360622 RepID=A0AAD8M1R2_9APIA|nr:hypothetical protein POM88_049509 [Heracleum sosnowskyi]